MPKELDNPFSDYGNIVREDRFIGRRENLRVIENRVLRAREPGNLAIIGEPRIGKSSLVYKAVMESRDQLIGRNILPIWVNLATYDSSSMFFRSLVTRCLDELEELGLLNDPMRKSSEMALQDELSWTEGYGRIQRFFEKIRRSNLRILFILDEFDHARLLFKGDISGFQGLRELSYRPEWRVTYITTSRRTIRDIELQTKAISTFDGIFHKHYLGMFDQESLEEFYCRLFSLGLPEEEILRNRIDFYCGGHPYLLEMLSYEVVESFFELGIVDVDRSANRVQASFLDQFDRIVELLRDDGSLNKILQTLFGPVVDVRQTDVDDFVRYGLLKPTSLGTYQAFSPFFQGYLTLIERQVDLWPTWRDTEMGLRRMITEKMIATDGENWLEELERRRPHLKKLFDNCRVFQAREVSSFGSRASTNLIDFTYPKDLFDIIFSEWNMFKDVLGRDKNYWHQRSELLSRIRNPLAHNRDQTLYDFERQIAEGYCKEIIEKIQGAGS
ncbi:MAG: Swt1 family HEPN domain-containing protein [Desulfomonile sp.]